MEMSIELSTTKSKLVKHLLGIAKLAKVHLSDDDVMESIKPKIKKVLTEILDIYKDSLFKDMFTSKERASFDKLLEFNSIKGNINDLHFTTGKVTIYTL